MKREEITIKFKQRKTSNGNPCDKCYFGCGQYGMPSSPDEWECYASQNEAGRELKFEGIYWTGTILKKEKNNNANR